MNVQSTNRGCAVALDDRSKALSLDELATVRTAEKVHRSNTASPSAIKPRVEPVPTLYVPSVENTQSAL
jgi:hypothetical protein